MGRTRIIVAVAMAGLGCGAPVEPHGDLPVRVSVQVTVDPGPSLTIRADLRNQGRTSVSIRVQCTPIFLDRDENGNWLRYEDLRFCAPPDRMTLRPGVLITVEDGRLVPSGRYRVVIESTDGRSAYSDPFTVSGIP